ncbi:MAG: hypothetical protein IPO81_07090 [Kouleothrix sp.]|nr:hypothetical protein [Kouleothrix sp.]
MDAEYGLDTPVHVKLEIEDAENNIRKIDLTLAKQKTQKADVQRQLDTLEAHWSEQQHKAQ